MAHYDHKAVYPFAAASPIGQFKPVFIASGGNVLPASHLSQPIDGITIATSPSALSDCAVVNAGVAKAIAGGTIFAGDIVGVATDGRLLSIIALGLPTVAAVARYQVGKSLNYAIAGQTFSVLLNCEQIV